MIYIIYIIRHKNKEIEWVYVGSTKNLRCRKNQHKCDCNNENRRHYNFPSYQFIRENGGWDEFEMIPIEECECENNTQAHIREEYWRVFYEAKGNSRKSYRSEEEKKEYNKKFKEENKEYLSQYNRKYCRDYYYKNKNEYFKKQLEKETI
jgi:hypothetical protein